VAAPGETAEVTGPRPHRVWAGLLLGAVIISLAAGALWGGFVLGARSFRTELIQAGRALQALQRERDDLGAELANLRQERIACESAQQIEQERDRAVQEQVTAAQNERAALANEGSSLKRLIHKAGRSAVVVQGLRLAAGEAERAFAYSFTVSQLIEDTGETSGAIGIKLSGKQGGKAKTLTLKQMKGSQPTGLTMHFDDFQTFEGHLVLPAGFEPEALTVEIDPKGGKLIASSETFPWRLTE
jgi:hypothetical protein